MDYDERLKKFKQNNAELISKYPEFESIFISIFNEGFSNGADWIKEKS